MVVMLTEGQSSLRAFVLSLMGGSVGSKGAIQEINIIKKTITMKSKLVIAAVVIVHQAAVGQELFVDFSRPGGPAAAAPYQQYTANHEVSADFTTQNFTAFGTTVSLTPSWGDDPGGLNTAKQMLQRSSASPAGEDAGLYRDWIGTDTRSEKWAANPLTLTISGLPSGNFELVTIHHDNDDQGGLFDLTVSDFSGVRVFEDLDQSNGAETPTLVSTQICSNGTDSITLEFSNASAQNRSSAADPNGAGGTNLFVLNGLQILEAGDSDGDCLDDLWEDRFFGDNSGTVESSDLSVADGDDDNDGDGLVNEQEENAGSNPLLVDTDNDGLDDDEEVETTGTDPAVADSDSDGIEDGPETTGEENSYDASGALVVSPPGAATDPLDPDSDDDNILDGEEVNSGNDGFITNPNSTDTDGDSFSDDFEVANQGSGFDPTVSNSTGDQDSDGLQNGDEVTAGTDPLVPDTDGDGRLDGEEVNGPVFSNPLLVDSDGDLATDKEEADNGTSPTDGAAFPRVAGLQIDFSLAGLAEPWNVHQLFYQPYLALHEVNSLASDPVGGNAEGVDRLNQSYPATFYSSAVSVAVSIGFPDLFDPVAAFEAKQLIDRGVLEYPDTDTGELMRDWIGVDSRFASGGNGIDIPTTLRLTLGNLPEGAYLLRTYHHDTDNQASQFEVTVTDADSSAEMLTGPFRQTTGRGSNFDEPAAGMGPETLNSTLEQVIRSNGSDPVVVDFSITETASFIFAMNGLELEEVVDADGDDIPDAVEIAIWGDTTTSDGTGDQDGDGISDLGELLRNLNPASNDTDGDGLTDDLETDTGAIAPSNATLSILSYDPVNEEVTLDWDPPAAASVYGSLTLQDNFPDLIAEDVTPPVTELIPLSYSGQTSAFFRLEVEFAGFGSNPHLADSDGDGLTDGREVNDLGTDPNVVESDGDGFDDGREVLFGSDPALASDTPDNDGDGWSKNRDPDDGDPAATPVPGNSTALFVDFNSNQNGGGDSSGSFPEQTAAIHLQAGYQSYHANHEVAAEFATGLYTAFGASVTLQPEWPDTTDNRVQQSLGRSDGESGNWDGDQLNLLRDWIGCDTRTGSGGNGDYDGFIGTPTRFQLRIGSLPAGSYHWRSYHHDVEHAWADYFVEVSIDGGATFGTPSATQTMTDSQLGGDPASPLVYRGFDGTVGSVDPAGLPSTFTTSFTADGTNDVVVRFTPIVDTGVNRRFMGINGFELTTATP